MRLKTLRAELSVIDEQLRYLADDAEDEEIRALVAENTGVTAEAKRARRHVDSMRKHREKVVAEIADLERRQDELLDTI